MVYKGYVITTRESEPGKWCAKISRADGREMAVVALNGEKRAEMESMDFWSADAATEQMQKSIDAGAFT
jgi:hypothetical protein